MYGHGAIKPSASINGMTLQVSSVPPLNVQSVIVMAISMPTMDAKLMPIAVLDAIILADQYFNLAQLSDNLFELVSLDSHNLILNLLIIPTDQISGGGPKIWIVFYKA